MTLLTANTVAWPNPHLMAGSISSTWAVHRFCCSRSHTWPSSLNSFLREVLSMNPDSSDADSDLMV